MKLIQICSIFLVFSTVLGESEYNYYQTHHDHYNQVQADPYAGYPSDLESGFNYVAEKTDQLDMDTILPIVVFGGLGLGALAYVDSLNRMNNLCNKLRSVTDAARGTVAEGATAVALTTADAGAAATNANTVINSNRVFINTLAAISSLDC